MVMHCTRMAASYVEARESAMIKLLVFHSHFWRFPMASFLLGAAVATGFQQQRAVRIEWRAIIADVGWKMRWKNAHAAEHYKNAIANLSRFATRFSFPLEQEEKFLKRGVFICSLSVRWVIHTSGNSEQVQSEGRCANRSWHGTRCDNGGLLLYVVPFVCFTAITMKHYKWCASSSIVCAAKHQSIEEK